MVLDLKDVKVFKAKSALPKFQMSWPVYFLNLTLSGPTPPQNLQISFNEIAEDSVQRWKCTATWNVSI